jgi:hypothetical protein
MGADSSGIDGTERRLQNRLARHKINGLELKIRQQVYSIRSGLSVVIWTLEGRGVGIAQSQCYAIPCRILLIHMADAVWAEAGLLQLEHQGRPTPFPNDADRDKTCSRQGVSHSGKLAHAGHLLSVEFNDHVAHHQSGTGRRPFI